MNKLVTFCVLFSGLAVVAGTSYADKIYKRVDSEGNVHFSDSPLDGGSEIHVKPLPTMPMPKVAAQPSRSSTDARKRGEEKPEDEGAYTGISITSPVSGVTLRQDADPLTISVSVQPELREGHAIQALMDGAIRGEPSNTTSVTISGIDRGSHELTVRVIDETGAPVLTSAPVTIFMHRTSVNQPNHPNNPAKSTSRPPAYTANPNRNLQPNPKPKPLGAR